MATKVRSYTDKELLDKVKSLPTFAGIPQDYWILGVQSNEDTPNVYDDKFYVYKGEKFIGVMTGTTNSGTYGLLNWRKWSRVGLAQIKPDEWYYNVWKRRLHNGKVEALGQSGAFKVIRDNNNNLKSGDKEHFTVEKNKGLNFHPNTYDLRSRRKKIWTIGRWSVGCQVVNEIKKYVSFLKISTGQNIFTYCLIKEF